MAAPVLQLGPQPVPVATSTRTGPTVVVLVSSLRPDHLGHEDYYRETSPNIDAFAAGAMRYSDASTASPWILPAVGSLLTGHLPSGHGGGINDGGKNLKTAMHPRAATLGQGLSERGFVSGAIVSSDWLATAYGFGRGFDWFNSTHGQGTAPVAVAPLIALDLPGLSWPKYRDAADVTDAAIGFIEQQPAGGDYLLFVQYADLRRAEQVSASEVADFIESHPEMVPEDAAFLDSYDAQIRKIDLEFGRLVEAIPDDALVIFTSDHGVELGEHRVRRSGVPPGTRYGHSMFQEVLHVPLLVAGPRIRPRTVSRPVSVLDIAPTIWKRAGFPLPDGIDGEPLIEVTGGRASRDRTIMAEGILHGRELQAARRGRYKLIVRTSGLPSLFDVYADPDEEASLIHADGSNKQTSLQLFGELPGIGGGRPGKIPVSEGLGRLFRGRYSQAEPSENE
jgi:arylsulfatase